MPPLHVQCPQPSGSMIGVDQIVGSDIPSSPDAGRSADQAASGALTRMADPWMRSVLTVQATILEAVRRFFVQKRFIEIIPPILALETDPGIRGAQTATTQLYGQTLKLTTSMNIQKFAAVAALGRVFSISPVIRGEPLQSLSTHRHLTEFRILEIEEAKADLEDIIRLCEELISFVVDAVKHACAAELSQLGRQLGTPQPPFARMSFRQAREMVAKCGIETPLGFEIPWSGEEALSRTFTDCFWITHFPNGTRGFYDREDPDDPSQLLDMDLIYPEGFGEACSGGEREYTFEGVRRQMIASGCDPAQYAGTLRLAQGTFVPSAGCGFGIERLTRYICGLPSIWDAVAISEGSRALLDVRVRLTSHMRLANQLLQVRA